MNILTVADLGKRRLLERVFDQLHLLLERRKESRSLAYLDGQIMATLFFEPSTRTRLSFESAMWQTGGKVISMADATTSSISKGESLSDTIQAVSHYANVLVIRSSEPIQNWGLDKIHPHVINAGDGSSNHPTQALLDAATIWYWNQKEHQIPQNKVFGISGDLNKSRTIRSFIELMTLYPNSNNRFYLFDSTGQMLENPFTGATVKHLSHADFVSVIPEMDVLYLNRVQHERNDGKHWGCQFVLNEDYLNSMKETCMVLNPGPRLNEIPDHLMGHDKVYMETQVWMGLLVRQALLNCLLDV